MAKQLLLKTINQTIDVWTAFSQNDYPYNWWLSSFYSQRLTTKLMAKQLLLKTINQIIDV